MALQVVLDTVDNDLLAHVDHLDVGEIRLILVTIDRLVDFFVVADAFLEVLYCLLWVLAIVVW